MSHVTAEQLSDWMDEDFDAAKRTRAAFLIRSAERYVTMRAGWDFYDPALPDSDRSVDWTEVVCRVAQKMLLTDTKAVQKHINGPYQSERNADYQYTLKTIGTDLRDDTEISRIINFWRDGTATPLAFATEGPSKNATKEYDPDVDQSYDITDILDISRYSVPFVSE